MTASPDPPSKLPGITACVAAMVHFCLGNTCTRLSLETCSVPQVAMLRLWTLLLMVSVLAMRRGGARIGWQSVRDGSRKHRSSALGGRRTVL
jgi:hypothetical protein